MLGPVTSLKHIQCALIIPAGACWIAGQAPCFPKTAERARGIGMLGAKLLHLDH